MEMLQRKIFFVAETDTSIQTKIRYQMVIKVISTCRQIHIVEKRQENTIFIPLMDVMEK